MGLELDLYKREKERRRESEKYQYNLTMTESKNLGCESNSILEEQAMMYMAKSKKPEFSGVLVSGDYPNIEYDMFEAANTPMSL